MSKINIYYGIKTTTSRSSTSGRSTQWLKKEQEKAETVLFGDYKARCRVKDKGNFGTNQTRPMFSYEKKSVKYIVNI